MLLKMLFLFCLCLNVSFLNSTPDEQKTIARYWISPTQVKSFLGQNSNIYDSLQMGEKSGVVNLDEAYSEIKKACNAVACRLVLTKESTLYDVLSQSFGASQKPPQEVEKFFCDNLTLDTHQGVLSGDWLSCGDLNQAHVILSEIGIALYKALQDTPAAHNYLNYWVMVATRQLSDGEKIEYTLEVACLIPGVVHANSEAQDHYLQNGDFLHEVALPAGVRTKLFVIGSGIVLSISLLFDYLVNNF